MVQGWIRRRAHTRHLARGRVAFVRESWAFQRHDGLCRRSYRHKCPHCGARIITVSMPNGGWAHFEGREGLARIKHPCLHIGEGLSRMRDEQTADLFANL
jgi:hypothetical protein